MCVCVCVWVNKRCVCGLTSVLHWRILERHKYVVFGRGVSDGPSILTRGAQTDRLVSVGGACLEGAGSIQEVCSCVVVCALLGGGVTEAHGSCAAAVLSVTVASLAAAAAAVACTKPHTLRPQPSSSDAAVCRPDRHHSHASAVCTRLPSVQVGHHARGAGMRQLCRGCPM